MPDTGNGAAPRVFSTKDAAALLGVSRSTLYVMNKRREIGFAKVAGRTVVPRREIDRITERIEADAATQTGAASVFD